MTPLNHTAFGETNMHLTNKAIQINLIQGQTNINNGHSGKLFVFIGYGQSYHLDIHCTL